ncbi:sensor domain-containing protein [Dehalogenimonas etheniformans]|uniref:Putative sensor domain-containing protein n=1 Tax=Dehalogenimonas etheniformans TaxID=1536648 RepID=A0A2P5P4X5_9CHLR|nr:sensor domain-containing protein [Dehalogenimonas etheniformans]PPD57340.1 hypothetical protein JP09_009875 [Dehalogenimonas etheniformans]QNT75191.1 sensor domain-containing protein [Dehalogenimonas etheniformans]
MINSIEEYLSELKKELAGSDPATIQDALADAEEYLMTALSGAVGQNPDINKAEALSSIISKYGEPVEVAAAYRENESRTPPAFAHVTVPHVAEGVPEAPAPDRRGFFGRFFGVFAEPKAWGSLFYLVLALVTGTIYFTWAVTGLAVSVSLLILIIGLPVAALFLLSVRGIALVEGRLVEALLGVRMPRRMRFAPKNTSLWQKLKNLLTDRHTWFSIVYMIVQLPLGIFYFTLFVTLIAFSLGLAFGPIVLSILNIPAYSTDSYEYFAPVWITPFTAVIGAFLLTGTMHLAKALGKIQGAIAKGLLVRQ